MDDKKKLFKLLKAEILAKQDEAFRLAYDLMLACFNEECQDEERRLLKKYNEGRSPLGTVWEKELDRLRARNDERRKFLEAYIDKALKVYDARHEEK